MFAFRLAGHLGMPVGAMLRAMSAREFSEWQAYFELDPFGEDRADFRTAIVAATVVNSNPWRKKGSKPARPLDFMPLVRGPRQPMPVEFQMAMAKALTQIHGGDVIEGPRPEVREA